MNSQKPDHTFEILAALVLGGGALWYLNKKKAALPTAGAVQSMTAPQDDEGPQDQPQAQPPADSGGGGGGGGSSDSYVGPQATVRPGVVFPTGAGGQTTNRIIPRSMIDVNKSGQDILRRVAAEGPLHLYTAPTPTAPLPTRGFTPAGPAVAAPTGPTTNVLRKPSL